MKTLLDSKFFDQLEASQSKGNKCRGNIYKARVSQYPTKRGFGMTIRMERMSKLSCPGCDYCGWVDDYLCEISDDGWPIIQLEQVENGKFYALEIVNVRKDWDSDMVEEWDLGLIEVDSKGIFLPESHFNKGSEHGSL